ncbi:hypothetical protein RJT34_33133 [Clitoria ternatea]|uniref:Secreted protein n=1 Tax=Clitoria ternatea TaxID=43366 RepID=A0AAN9EZT3_CLITE
MNSLHVLSLSFLILAIANMLQPTDELVPNRVCSGFFWFPKWLDQAILLQLLCRYQTVIEEAQHQEKLDR